MEEEGEINSTDYSFSDSANESGNSFPILTNPVINNKSILLLLKLGITILSIRFHMVALNC